MKSEPPSKLASIEVGKSRAQEAEEAEQARILLEKQKAEEEAARIEAERIAAEAKAAAEREAAQKAQIAARKAKAVQSTPKPKETPRVAASVPAAGSIAEQMKAKVVARWGEGQWPAMAELMRRESGSNPYAKNPSSGACGIPQALPCSKLLNVIGSLDNIDGQLQWMVDYVANRYGTPSAAISFHNSHNWY